MTLREVAADAERPLGTVHSWITAGHLPATFFQPIGPDGAPFGDPAWFIAAADWQVAKPKCLALRRGPKPRGKTA